MNTQKTGSKINFLTVLAKRLCDFFSTVLHTFVEASGLSEGACPQPASGKTKPLLSALKRTGNCGLRHKILTLALLAAMGFVLSLGGFGQSVYPFGTAFLISGAMPQRASTANPAKKRILLTREHAQTVAILAGVLGACFTYESFGLVYVGLNLAVFVVKIGFRSSGINEGKTAKVITAAGACLLVSVPRIIFEPSAFSIALSFLHIGLTVSSVLALSSYSAKGCCEESTLVKYAASAVFVYCLRGVTYFGTSVSFVAASIGVMCFSALWGSFYGCVAGVVLGAACFGDACFPTVLAFCGICDGVFNSKNPRVRGNMLFIPTVHTLCAVICALLFGVSGKEKSIVIDSLVAVFLYMSFMHRLHANQSAAIVTEKESGRDVYETDFEGISEAFAWLSGVFYQMSDKLKNPPPYEVRIAVERACRGFCAKCASSAGCKTKSVFYGSEYVIRKLSSACGKLTVSELPQGLADGCVHPEKLVGEINLSYKNVFSDYFKNNKTEILAAQYSSMAHLIRHTAKSCAERSLPCIPVAASAFEALAKMGIRPEKVTASSGRGTVIDACGVRIETVSKSAAELSSSLSKATGILLSTPEFIMDGTNTRMRFRQKRKICVEYAKACHAKNGEGISGDSVSFFESDRDCFYALISDGMGSGREAALTSRLTAVFIEKLLSTGAHKGATLELLNNLLLSKNNESFATVDLLEIDLLEARASFIKAGAAPAFVVRSAKLYKISSETPPAGIINAFTAENTSFSLCPGDVILLLSDGIIESYDSTPWLAEILGFNRGGDISELASKILARAKEMVAHDDDMSVVAVRIR